jgi:hypothetical protein
VLDAVDDLLLIIKKDDIAVLAHQFNDKRVAAEIAHLVEVLYFKAQNTFKTRLGDREDPAVLKVFAKKHTEGGRLKRSLSVFGREIGKGERGVRGEIEPALAASPLSGGL